jgi:hypothetical protein
VIEKLSEREVLQFPVPLVKPSGILAVIKEMVKPDGIQEVKLVCHDWKTHLFHSALFRYEDRAEIHYSAHSNLCWRRFAICKEAMHLLIDTEPGHFTTDVPSLIERMIIGGELEPDTPVESEWIGEAAAIEMLLPWKLRSVMEDMSKAGETDYQIAVQARTPLKYVTAMLRGVYGRASKGLNKQLDETDSVL